MDSELTPVSDHLGRGNRHIFCQWTPRLLRARARLYSPSESLTESSPLIQSAHGAHVGDGRGRHLWPESGTGRRWGDVHYWL